MRIEEVTNYANPENPTYKLYDGETLVGLVVINKSVATNNIGVFVECDVYNTALPYKIMTRVNPDFFEQDLDGTLELIYYNCIRAYIDSCKKNIKRILKTFDIPENRLEDYPWLNGNLGIDNADNPKLTEAMELIKELIKYETR